MKSTNSKVICPSCGSEKFRQEVTEIYYKYLGGHRVVSELEYDLTHDFEFGIVME